MRAAVYASMHIARHVYKRIKTSCFEKKYFVCEILPTSILLLLLYIIPSCVVVTTYIFHTEFSLDVHTFLFIPLIILYYSTEIDCFLCEG